MDSEARAFLVEHMTSLETTEKWYPYSLPTQAFLFGRIEELRHAVTSSGSHFFDRDAMRFFKSRVALGIIGGRFFITSEQMSPSQFHAGGPTFEGDDGDTYPRQYTYPREYSVRWVYKWEGASALQVDRFTDRFPTVYAARRFAHKAHSVLPFPGSEEQ